MAAGGSGKGWKNQEDNSGGSWLLTGLKIGAALGAAALGTYAAVKLAQEEKEPPMLSRFGSDSSGGSEGNRDTPSGFDQKPASSSGSKKLPKSRRKPPGGLADELNEYFSLSQVASSEKRMFVQDLVEKTRQRISSYLTKKHPRHIKSELTPAPFDDVLFESGANVFKMMLPLGFDHHMWQFIDATDTVLDIPGFFCVRRVNLDFFRIGKSPWDSFLVGSYLCPEHLTKFWKKIVDGMLNEEMIVDFYCNVKQNASGVELNIENPVGRYANGDMIHLQIIPCFKFEKNGKPVVITVESVSQHQSQLDYGQSATGNPHENLWFHSREVEIVEKIQYLDKHGGCRQKCIAILDALRYTNPPLKMLSPYLLATIILRLCKDETYWEEEMIAERFLDLLKTLEGHLRDGAVRDVFDDEVNVLSWCCSPKEIGELRRWLAHVLASKDRISDLLYRFDDSSHLISHQLLDKTVS